MVQIEEHKEPPDCQCGHSWESHHHSIIMNPAYPTEDHTQGICNGVGAEECEETQSNGEWLVEKEEDLCRCGNYEVVGKS